MKILGRVAFVLLAPGLVILLSPSPAGAAISDSFYGGESYVLSSGETHTGDLYVSAGSVTISGRLDGDLFTATSNVMISGEVTGDLVAGGSLIDISGRVGDSVRAFAGTVTISGTLDGDLLACGGTVTIHERAHITGNVYTFSGVTIMAGTTDGNFTATGGEINVNGTVGRNATIEADVVRVSPDARIAGDLAYTSRKELELASPEIVGGEVLFKKKIKKDDSDGDSSFSGFALAFRLWMAFSTLLIGSLLVALLRPAIPAIVTPVGRETLIGGLIGFGIALVVPAAAVILMLLVLSFPLGLITLGLYVLVMYLAKLPVAIWIGQRLLGLAGRADPSPYLGLVLGTVVLYVLFSIPYLRWPLWFVVAFLGLGAIILATRAHLRPQTT